MLHATTDAINSAPPLYFVVTWVWAAVFGHSALALRLFSAISIATASLLLFYVLRRAYGSLAATLALLVALSNKELLLYSVEMRFHALFFTEIVACLALYQRLLMQAKPSVRLLALNAFAHSCLVLTHYFAPFYSGAILIATLLVCIVRRWNPIPACLSIVIGWLAFLPWIPAFLNHAQMAKPSTWIPRPGSSALPGYYQTYLGSHFLEWALTLAVVAMIGSLAAARYGGLRRTLGPSVRELPLLLVSITLLGVPLIVYLYSVQPASTPLFTARYLTPSILGAAIICAHLAHRAFRRSHVAVNHRFSHALVVLKVLATVVLATYVIWQGAQEALREKKRSPTDFAQGVPDGETVVLPNIHLFLSAHFFSAHPSRFVAPLDWDVGLAEKAGGPGRQRILQALKRRFPEEFPEIKSTDEILSAATTFWIRPQGSLWAQVRLMHNPDFIIEKVNNGLLHVRRTTR